MRPPSPWPSEAGPTDSPTQTRGVGRTPGASARPGHGSAGGQVGEKIPNEKMSAVGCRCAARLGPVFSCGGTLSATGLLATCHLALLAAFRCHRAPVSCPRLHKTRADLTGPPVPPDGAPRAHRLSGSGPRQGATAARDGSRAVVIARRSPTPAVDAAKARDGQLPLIAGEAPNGIVALRPQCRQRGLAPRRNAPRGWRDRDAGVDAGCIRRHLGS